MEDGLQSWYLETKIAAISGHVASGPLSPDAVSSLLSLDAHNSDNLHLENLLLCLVLQTLLEQVLLGLR